MPGVVRRLASQQSGLEFEQLVPAFLQPATSGRGQFEDKTVGMGNQPATAADECCPERLHPDPHPSGAGNHQVTAGQDKIVTETGQEDPAAVGPELARWQHPAGKIGLHDAVRLFTVTTPEIGLLADVPHALGRKGSVVGVILIRRGMIGGKVLFLTINRHQFLMLFRQ